MFVWLLVGKILCDEEDNYNEYGQEKSKRCDLL